MFRIPDKEFEIKVTLPTGSCYYHLVQELKEDLDVENIERALFTQPEKFVYCGVLKGQVQRRYSQYKSQELPLEEAKLYREARKILAEGKLKVTEAMVEEYVRVEFADKLEELYSKLFLLEEELKILEVGLEAFRMRASILQSVSAMRRQERELYGRDVGEQIEGYVERKLVRK